MTDDKNYCKPTTVDIVENEEEAEQEEGEEEDSSLLLLDITTILRECTEHDLGVTEPFLCNEKTFSLHDAMGATQLLDPKMDCCQIPASQVMPIVSIIQDNENKNNNNNHHDDDKNNDDRMVFPRPVPSSLTDPMTPLPWDDLTLTDAAIITVQILVRLQSLISGASVGESTFTCLYAHAAVLADMKEKLWIDDTNYVSSSSLESKFKHLKLKVEEPTVTHVAQMVIFASALALVDTTEVVRGVILNADIYEEEDFATNTHSIPFYTDRANMDTSNILQSALEEIKKIKQQPCDDEHLKTMIDVIHLTIGFQYDFFLACSTLARLSQKELHGTIIIMQHTLRNAGQKLDHLQQLVDTLSAKKDGLLEQRDDNIQLRSLLQKTFDSYVNRQSVGNLPVRKISLKEPPESLKLLKSITHDMEAVLCNLLLKGSTLGRVQRMLDRAGRSDINILTRSLVLLNLYFDEKLLGQYSLRQLIIDHMKQWGCHLPESLLASEHARAFLNRLAKPVYDNLKLRLLNRNRHRAYIEAVSLPDWTVLQNEASLVDAHYRQQQQFHQQHNHPNHQKSTTAGGAPPQYYFSQYVVSVLIRLMDRFIESGIEVGQFVSTDNRHYTDLSFAIWYRAFLLSALSHDLSTMREPKEQELIASKNAEAQKGNTRHVGKGRKKQQKNKGSAQQHNNVVPQVKETSEDLEDKFELKLILIKRNLCRKIIEFMAALQQANILKNELQDGYYQFTSMERIFEKRFEAFDLIRQPPKLSFQHYKEGIDFSKVTQSDLIQSISTGFQSIRAELEELAQDLIKDSSRQSIDPMYAPITENEIKTLIKVCVGNSVYVQKLRQVVQSGKSTPDNVKVVFDFESHNQFCTIKLV